MGTIEQKVDYLKETKQAIRTAIEEKGVSVADTDTFRSYASKIGTISVGGGGTKWYVGDFYDGQMYEGNNGDLFLNTGTTDQGTILQFTDGTWNPVGNLMGPQGSQGAQGLSGASEPVGSIILWGGDSVPDNYLPCVGSAVSRTEYSDLFSVIGTQFGEGDGSTTFNLPDFSGLAPVGIDDSDTNFNAVGKTYGEKTHTLTKAETPSLTGSIQTRQQNDNNTIDIYPTGSATESVFTYTKNGGDRWNNMGSGWATANSNNARIDFDNGGEDEPHNNIQPSIAMKFYIKAYQATAIPAQVVDSLSGDSTTDAPSVHAVNQKLQELTGGDDSWKDAALTADFALYNDGSGGCKYRKTGKVVEIFGQIRTTSTFMTDGTEKTIFTLPEGYRPSKNRYYICQGSYRNIWLLSVSYTGAVRFSRYGTSEFAEVTDSNWLPFSAVFTTDESEGISVAAQSETGDSPITINELYTGDQPATITVTLNETYENYDMVYVLVRGDWNHEHMIPFVKGYYNRTQVASVCQSLSYATYGYVKLHDENQCTLTAENNKDLFAIHILKVIGIRFNNSSASSLDDTYPVNSVYISSTNTNPATSLGGTWELIDKEFSPTTSSNTGFNASSDITTNSVRWSRSGHSLDFEFTFTSSAALTDEVIILGTLDYSVMGVERLNHTLRVVGSSDGANSLFILYINATTGEVQSVDSIGETTVAAGNSCYAFFSMNINPDFMLDSACNKFYWKRVS